MTVVFGFHLYSPHSIKADGTTLGVTATRSGVSDGYLHPTQISGHTDAASKLQIISGASTVKWEADTGAGGFDILFSGGVFAALGEDLKAKIVTSSSACSITLQSGVRK